MTEFDIKPSLKNHYLFEYSINQLLDTFILVFEKEKKELLRQFEHRLESIYLEQSFSSTVFNISDMIVFKYFNGELSFAEKCFIKSNKFRGYPFLNKIKKLELGSA